MPLDEILDLARLPPRFQYMFYREQGVVRFHDKLEFIRVERVYYSLAVQVNQRHREHSRAHKKHLFGPIADAAFLERESSL